MRNLFFGALFIFVSACGAIAEEINIYSYRQPDLLKPLTQAFSQQTGIQVNVAYLEKGMIERLTAEGKRSPADLILTVDIARLSSVVKAGLTQPIITDQLKQNVPETFRDPAGHWWGLSTRARVIYASRERVNQGEVTTFDDLVNPKWRGRICTRSGTHAYNVALTAAALYHMGRENTRAWLEGIKANLARKPQGNDRAQIKAIWAGECDIAIGNTYYMGIMLADEEQKQWADSVRIVFPVFQGGGAHMNISGVALAKHAPNRDAAIKMIEFLTSPLAQEIYAKANFEYPVSPNSQPDELVASWGSFIPDTINLMDLAALRPAALRLIEEVDFDG